jgi:nicotinamide-nucleotide amidase
MSASARPKADPSHGGSASPEGRLSDDEEVLGLSERLGTALRARGWTVATAESCTGGLVGAALTAVAGSSDYYVGGAVAYANAAKMALLAVAESTLRAHGAVSEQTAAEMAMGALANLDADIAVSVTGIAGPAGATEHKEVGLVFVGVAGPTRTWVERLQLSGDRATVRRGAVLAALAALLAEAAPDEP